MESEKLHDQLVDRAIAGDMDAFHVLLKELHPRLLNYVGKNLPKKLAVQVDPTDIMQDTYFEAWRLIGGFQPQGKDSLYRWVATIARHRIVDLLRRAEARKRQAGDNDDIDGELLSMLEALAVYRRTPSQSARAHEFFANLEQSLQRLPELQRVAVMSRHLEGLTVEETAEKIGRSREDVSVFCCRGLRALREDLRSASRFF